MPDRQIHSGLPLWMYISSWEDLSHMSLVQSSEFSEIVRNTLGRTGPWTNFKNKNLNEVFSCTITGLITKQSLRPITRTGYKDGAWRYARMTECFTWGDNLVLLNSFWLKSTLSKDSLPEPKRWTNSGVPKKDSTGSTEELWEVESVRYLLKNLYKKVYQAFIPVMI